MRWMCACVPRCRSIDRVSPRGWSQLYPNWRSILLHASESDGSSLDDSIKLAMLTFVCLTGFVYSLVLRFIRDVGTLELLVSFADALQCSRSEATLRSAQSEDVL
ncbi:hypothetical protein Tco_0479496 [Tanacetum coccineum]